MGIVGDDCGVRRRTKEEMGTKEELGTSDWASGSTSLHCRVGRAAFMLTSRSVLGCVRGEADKGCLKTMSTSSTLPCVRLRDALYAVYRASVPPEKCQQGYSVGNGASSWTNLSQMEARRGQGSIHCLWRLDKVRTYWNGRDSVTLYDVVKRVRTER